MANINSMGVVQTRYSQISSFEHWDGWRRLDNSMGATAKIYARVDSDGVMRVYKYVTRLGNQKTIYLIGKEGEK